MAPDPSDAPRTQTRGVEDHTSAAGRPPAEPTQTANSQIPTAPTLSDDPAPCSCQPGDESLPPTDAHAPGSSDVRLRDATPAPTSSARSRLSDPADWPHIEGYEILGQLGKDGQGQVYHAREKRLGLEVALKVPHRCEGAWAEMFLREARALAQVNHRNVVEIKAYDVRGEVAFFTMRLVRGPNLARVVRLAREHGQPEQLTGRELCNLLGLDPRKLCPELRDAARQPRPWFRFAAIWIAQAADGLAAAHEHGVLHRDVKPSNLILDEDGRVVVVDFGLARPLREQPDPAALGVTGTLPYLAPERVLGDWARVDHRADIWALGATLYELLTLTRAYDRRGRDVLQQIATKDPPRPREHRPAIPAALERICLRMMHRDPDRRYDDYRELAAALRTSAHAGIAARTPGRPMLVGSIASACVLIAGAAWWYAASHRGAQPTAAAAAVHTTQLTAPAQQPPVPTPPDNRRQQPPSAPPEQPGTRPPAHAQAPVLPQHPAPLRQRVILLFAEQDLNTRDRRPAEPNPDLAGMLRDALERRLDFEINAGRVELRDAPLTDEPLARAQVIELARQQGANTVGYVRLRARPIQKVTGLKYGDETVYRWRVTLACELIDVASGRTLATPATSGEATVAAVPIVGSQHDYRWRFDDSGGQEHHTHNYKPYEPPGEFPGPSENDTVRELVVKVAKRLVTTIRRLGEAP